MCCTQSSCRKKENSKGLARPVWDGLQKDSELIQDRVFPLWLAYGSFESSRLGLVPGKSFYQNELCGWAFKIFFPKQAQCWAHKNTQRKTEWFPFCCPHLLHLLVSSCVLLKGDRKGPHYSLNLYWKAEESSGYPQSSISALSSMQLLHHSLVLISPSWALSFLGVSTGEAGKGGGEEHSLCFTLSFLQELNYVIFVKASLLLSYCGPQTSPLADGGAP